MNPQAPGARRSEDWRLIACVLTPLLIGQCVPALVFALDSTAATGISPADVGLPAWWFVFIFSVIYSGMGVAIWQVLRDADTLTIPAGVLLAAIGVGFAQTLLFWSARGLPAILVADLNAVLMSAAVTALVFWFCRPAAWWLLPWVIWMMATTLLKILVIASA